MSTIVMIRAGLSAAALSLLVCRQASADSPKSVNVPAGDLTTALEQIEKQSGVEIVYRPELLKGLHTDGVSGTLTSKDAVTRLLKGTKLKLKSDKSGVLLIEDAANDPAAAPLHRTESTTAADSPLIGEGDTATPDQPVSDDSRRSENAGDRGDPGASALDEIIVTAQKRQQRLIDVPESISVLSGDTLISRNEVHLADYLQSVPGVSIDALGDGRTQIVMRGLSTGEGTNPTVGITIDDAPFGSTTWAGLGDSLRPDLDPFDISQIEVLKGPQGTLYGANTLGGLIKYETVQPDPTAFQGRVETDISATQGGGINSGARAAVNIPLSDTFATRASVFYKRDGGFIDDTEQGRSDANSAHSYGGRLAAKLDLGPLLTIEVSALLQDNLVNGSTTEDVWLNGSPVDGDLVHRRAPGTDYYDSQIQFYDLNTTSDFGPTTLRSITSYSHSGYAGTSDYTPTVGSFVPLFYNGITNANVSLGNDVSTRKITEELRLQSNGDGRLDWMAGFFYQHEDNQISQPAFLLDPTSGIPLDVAQFLSDVANSTFEEYAGFVNATWHVTDRVDLQAGLRESHNDQTYLEIANGPLNGGMSVASGTSSDSSLTYLATAEYKFTRDAAAYVRFTSGYRPGGPNSVAPSAATATYKPDYTHNYELGLKGQIPSGTLSIEAAVFLIDWDQVQIRVIDATDGFSYFANATSARSTGAESTLQWKPFQKSLITGNVTYTDAVLTGPLPMGSYGQAGDPLPYTPKWGASAAFQQTLSFTSSLNGLLQLDLHYTGSRMADFTGSATIPRFDLGSFVTSSARFALTWDHWGVNFFVNNLTNSRGLLSAQPLNGIANVAPYAAGVITPRTGGLSANFTF